MSFSLKPPNSNVVVNFNQEGSKILLKIDCFIICRNYSIEVFESDPLRRISKSGKDKIPTQRFQ